MLHTGGGGGGGGGGGDEDDVGGGQSRISVPFFYEPNFECVVAPLPQFCGGGKGEEKDGAAAEDGALTKFEPIMYGEHLTNKVYSNFIEGAV